MKKTDQNHSIQEEVNKLDASPDLIGASLIMHLLPEFSDLRNGEMRSGVEFPDQIS